MFGKDYLNRLKQSPGWPSDKDFEKGPVAVIECIQEIPCNPCETVCPKNCIKVGDPITNLPKFKGNCSGCGKCVIECPGLAIFIIDKNFSEKSASIILPYELLPLPKKGDVVIALDREGNEVCEALVQRVNTSKSFNKTALITIVVPKEFIDEVRFFKIKEQG